jgi:hypothetical protein
MLMLATEYTMTAKANMAPSYTSAAIHARSSIIKVVTRSTLESELYAIKDIASEILYERDIMNEIGYLQGPTIVGEDNQGAISLLLGSDLITRRIPSTFIMERISIGCIAVEYTPTAFQQADTCIHWLRGFTSTA